MTIPKDMRAFNRELIAKFRESGGVGEIGPVNFEGLVLLTTTGRKSGQARTTPLGHVKDDAGNLILFGSNMGAPTDPDWVGNIAADPHVHVEVTGNEWDAEAEILDGAEREDALRRWLAVAPHTADHEDKAGRPIPMIRVSALPDSATTGA